MSRILAAVVALCLSGCSFFIKNSFDTPPAQCSSFAPVVDTTLAVGFASLAVVSFAGSAAQSNSDNEGEAGAGAAAAIGALLLVPTLVAVIAADQGFGDTARCRAARTAATPS